MRNLFVRVRSLRHRKMVQAVIFGLFVVMLVAGLALGSATPAQADGWCVYGYTYGGSGTAHNYVEFKVSFNAVGWHIHHNWLSWMFPASPWAGPDGNGIVRAGISRTDYNPPYSPQNYQLCGTR